MANRDVKASRSDVLQGTLDLMVLQTLAALGQSHGYAIAARIEQVSHGAIQLNMGTLYPALVRLGHRGFIRGKWDTTENNRRARFYQLTAAGRKQLKIERADWEHMAEIMYRLLSNNF
jgi:PadR family transcriptional regulator